MILINHLKSVNFAQLCARACGANCAVPWIALRTLPCAVTQVHMSQR